MPKIEIEWNDEHNDVQGAVECARCENKVGAIFPLGGPQFGTMGALLASLKPAIRARLKAGNAPEMDFPGVYYCEQCETEIAQIEELGGTE